MQVNGMHYSEASSLPTKMKRFWHVCGHHSNCSALSGGGRSYAGWCHLSEATRMSEVVTEVRDTAGLVTLNRPRALNALSLDMIRALTVTLLAWADDPRVQRVAVRGMGREGP